MNIREAAATDPTSTRLVESDNRWDSMIVKQRDATRSRIAYLENYAAPGLDTIAREGLKQAAARLRADSTSGNACRYIDSYFAESKEWLVIHDLRLRHSQQIIQINHLLISNSFEFYIVDSRYLKCALALHENGRCCALTSNHSTPVASPLNKLNRDIRLLRKIIKNMKGLPTFLGVSPTLCVKGYVLTNPSLKSSKPPSSVLDSSAVITSDTLFAALWEKRQNWVRNKIANVSPDTLHDFTQALLSLHIPSVSTTLLGTKPAKHQQPSERDTSHCAQCSMPVTAHLREQCFKRMDVFQGQVLCLHCQYEAQIKIKGSSAL